MRLDGFRIDSINKLFGPRSINNKTYNFLKSSDAPLWKSEPTDWDSKHRALDRTFFCRTVFFMVILASMNVQSCAVQEAFPCPDRRTVESMRISFSKRDSSVLMISRS